MRGCPGLFIFEWRKAPLARVLAPMSANRRGGNTCRSTRRRGLWRSRRPGQQRQRPSQRLPFVMFWPAAFFVASDRPNAAEAGRLKGEMQAPEQVSIQKNCGIQFRQD
jgi:hypothetical protein